MKPALALSNASTALLAGYEIHLHEVDYSHTVWGTIFHFSIQYTKHGVLV
jgi:hypothetical protein